MKTDCQCQTDGSKHRESQQPTGGAGGKVLTGGRFRTTLYRLLLNDDRMSTPRLSKNVTEQLTHNGGGVLVELVQVKRRFDSKTTKNKKHDILSAVQVIKVLLVQLQNKRCADVFYSFAPEASFVIR